MFYVYALKSLKDGTLYVGLTNNVERRVTQHNNGQQRSTRSHVPYRLLLVEEHETRADAREREKYYKTGIGREALKRSAAYRQADVVERQT